MSTASLTCFSQVIHGRRQLLNEMEMSSALAVPSPVTSSTPPPMPSNVTLTEVRLKMLPPKAHKINLKWVSDKGNYDGLKKVIPHLADYGNHESNVTCAKRYHMCVCNKLRAEDTKNIKQLAIKYELKNPSTGAFLQSHQDIVAAALSNDDELDFDAWLDRAVGVTKAPYSGDSCMTKWLKEAVEQVKTELKICFGKDGKKRVNFISEIAQVILTDSRSQSFRRQMLLHFPDKTWVERRGGRKEAKARKDGKTLTWYKRNVHGISGWEGTYQREGYLEKASRLAQIGDIVNKANRANVSLDGLLTMVKEVYEKIAADGEKVISEIGVPCSVPKSRFCLSNSPPLLAPSVSPSKLVMDLKSQKKCFPQILFPMLLGPQLMMRFFSLQHYHTLALTIPSTPLSPQTLTKALLKTTAFGNVLTG